mgnify:CR=1 FL=1
MRTSIKKEIKKYIYKNATLKKELDNIKLEKEIMKKIPKNLANYTIEKIIIL